MTTNFFENQERARRDTTWLVLLYVPTVIGLGVGIYVVTELGVIFRGVWEGPTVLGVPWEPEWFLWVLAGTLAFVVVTSLVRVLSLRGNVRSLAWLLGGRPVSRDTHNEAELRLLDVVDEMAIASGIPVPEVFVLDREVGINAFAAGRSTDHAIVAVTHGALRFLDRHELQGIVAHEFSHILNGDMRLNLRLIGVLFGIFAIAVFGRLIVYFGRSSKTGVITPMWAIGLPFILVGHIGVFMGRLIQAAVCRQREFLADASAVQFTRNPAGIGGALLKIAGLEQGSLLASSRASEAAHLFFGEGVPFMFGLFSTHPSIEERIRRIDPSLIEDMEVDAESSGKLDSETKPGVPKKSEGTGRDPI